MKALKQFIVATGFILFAITASAETQKRSGGGSSQQTAQMQLLMQQVAAERDRAVADKVALQKEIESLKSDLAKAEKKNKTLNKKLKNTSGALNKFKGSNDELGDRLVESQKKMKELIGKFRETIANLKSVENQKASVETRLGSAEKELKQCSEHNVQLYSVNRELIGEYEEKGVIDSLRSTEPVLGLGRVDIENIAQAYQDKIDELRYRVDLAN